jgi:hypothetical protein
VYEIQGVFSWLDELVDFLIGKMLDGRVSTGKRSKIGVITCP